MITVLNVNADSTRLFNTLWRLEMLCGIILNVGEYLGVNE